MNFTEEQKNKWADDITSYGDGESRVLAESGLSLDELTEMMLDMNIEKCPNCYNWEPSHSLLNDESEVDGFCNNCRKHTDD